jgi:hypothetical protein
MANSFIFFDINKVLSNQQNWIQSLVRKYDSLRNISQDRYPIVTGGANITSYSVDSCNNYESRGVSVKQDTPITMGVQRFFASEKKQCTLRRSYDTMEEIEKERFEYSPVLHSKTKHSNLGYSSPIEIKRRRGSGIQAVSMGLLSLDSYRTVSYTHLTLPTN